MFFNNFINNIIMSMIALCVVTSGWSSVEVGENHGSPNNVKSVPDLNSPTQPIPMEKWKDEDSLYRDKSSEPELSTYLIMNMIPAAESMTEVEKLLECHTSYSTTDAIDLSWSLLWAIDKFPEITIPQELINGIDTAYNLLPAQYKNTTSEGSSLGVKDKLAALYDAASDY